MPRVLILVFKHPNAINTYIGVFIAKPELEIQFLDILYVNALHIPPPVAIIIKISFFFSVVTLVTEKKHFLYDLFLLWKRRPVSHS